MKLSRFRRLIREEVRKSVSPRRRSRLHEAVKPMPLDSSITSQLVFIPVEDIDMVADYVGGSGELTYSIFILNGPKTGVIVKKDEVRDAIQTIEDAMEAFG